MDLDAILRPLDPLLPRNAPARPRQPWSWRIGQMLLAYLPLLLMAMLALATWWLVQHTPRAEGPSATAVARHEPDYVMQDFTLQRFGADGRLKVQVQGTQMRHYPDTDMLEVDGVTIRALAPDGGQTRATARRALTNRDASEVQLVGGARVVRDGREQQPQIEFESEFLHAYLDAERLRSHLPVLLRQGGSELKVGSIDYDNLTRIAKFGAPVRARFEPPRR